MSATTLAPDILAQLRLRFTAFLPRVRKLARQAFARITCPDRFQDCVASAERFLIPPLIGDVDKAGDHARDGAAAAAIPGR